jgi:hypothetical protein
VCFLFSLSLISDDQGNEIEWWRYALRCILRKIQTAKAEWTFQHMKQFTLDSVLYCRAITEGKVRLVDEEEGREWLLLSI